MSPREQPGLTPEERARADRAEAERDEARRLLTEATRCECGPDEQCRYARERDTLRDALRGADEEVRRLRNALGEIANLTPALRAGGPDPADLHGLSEALEEATGIAHAALAALEDT